MSNELFGNGSACVQEETTGINICTPTIDIPDVGDIPSCSTDIDCSDPLPVCNTIIGVCIALPPIDISCQSDADCQDPLPTCDTESGECYLGCESSADCVNNTLCAASGDITEGCSCAPDRILGQFNICTPSISCNSNSDCNVLASVCNGGQCESCAENSDCDDLDACSDYGCTCQIGGICNPISISIPDSFNTCSPSDDDDNCDDLYSCQSIPGISDTIDQGVCILDALSICSDENDCDEGWMCSSSLSGQNSFLPSICYIDCDNNKDCQEATGDDAFECQEINFGLLTSSCLPGSLEDPTEEPTVNPTPLPTPDRSTAERIKMFCLIVIVMFIAILM